ncbi:rhomboid family intramembrane serine protease [Marivirga sp. S37H4]|uniref:Rhomboid family intramembrane serine protease n=1 Tax=Marivirga aurantiaca TaxID=2802615 RepID=A0A935CB84_9BACT|nr:rhomboid family intramembrane serine protease [Marivirga aurantiaca]MBK6266637.1 rhomboid family intramembrane serine protease [Marivirga aurantiaca]
MAGIFDELRQNFRRPNNALNQLIIINAVVFVGLGILGVISAFTDSQNIYAIVDAQFTIPPDMERFIYRPWTLITYAFSHAGFLHILFNMLALYWFGMLISQYLGSAKLVNLYILGALAGAVIFILAYNLIPFLAERGSNGMVGASAAVFAIATAAATLLPDYRFHLIFIGPVKIKYIVAVYILMSILGSAGANAGGNIAHLGGAGIGFLYVRGLQAGTDFGLWIQKFLEGITNLFKSKPKIRVTHRSNKSSATKSSSTQKQSKSSKVEQEEIDLILDKISEKGYESLSREEKQKLFNASKK